MFKTAARISVALVVAGTARTVSGQTFDSVGTRAAGMGGAFVAVADDASAAYWNPAGFASGNIFTMVVDRTTAKVNRTESDGARQTSGVIVSLGTPALGFSFYRLEHAQISPLPVVRGGSLPSPEPRETSSIRVDSLFTTHTGATVVQSIAQGLAVGATLKVVHGSAASSIEQDGNRSGLLAGARELLGERTSRFDADVGVMASSERLKAGFTVRNLMQPEFRTSAGFDPLRLPRQARAGVAWMPVQGWAIAVDLDVTRTREAVGTIRDFAAGTEGRLSRKAFVRSGFRLNTAGPSHPSVSAGASYAVMGSILLDTQGTWGSDSAARGWGIAARFVY